MELVMAFCKANPVIVKNSELDKKNIKIECSISILGVNKIFFSIFPTDPVIWLTNVFCQCSDWRTFFFLNVDVQRFWDSNHLYARCCLKEGDRKTEQKHKRKCVNKMTSIHRAFRKHLQLCYAVSLPKARQAMNTTHASSSAQTETHTARSNVLGFFFSFFNGKQDLPHDR